MSGVVIARGCQYKAAQGKAEIKRRGAPAGGPQGDGDTMDYAAARQNMIEGQIRPNRVTDEAVIEAMASMPRELFVPEPVRSIAYCDEDIPIGNGRFMMEPMVLAQLLQAAAIQPTDVVLDIGCGTGYSAAVAARLANTVVAVESDPALAARATELFAELSIDNVAVFEGPLVEGCPKQAPYQVILLDGAVEFVPPAILEQLAEGGRLVTVVEEDGVGRATLMQRTRGVTSGRVLFDASIARLPGFARAPGFVF